MGVMVLAKRAVAWLRRRDPGDIEVREAIADIEGETRRLNRLVSEVLDFAKGATREKQDAQGTAGIAMRFTAMQPGVDVLIVGTSKPERWAQNADLLSWKPSILDRYYTADVLWSDRARRTFVMPDNLGSTSLYP